MSELNDPRVLFAAERTLLAWSRTSLTLMGFGFVIERFGLFLHMLIDQTVNGAARSFSFWVGILFILLGVVLALVASVQFRAVVRRLKPAQVPQGYFVNLGVLVNLLLAVLGLAVIVYLIHGF